MLASSIPTKIVLPFANNAGGSYINVVPVPSQIGITNGAASFYDGFPPNTFVALAAGGAGPFGKDFNGLLNVMSAWERWYCAGGPINWDSAFSTSLGGYPVGAIVQSNALLGLFWISTVDNNTTNPDASGAGWRQFNRILLSAATNFYVSTTGSDDNNGLTSGAPWATLQHAWNTLQQYYDLAGQVATINIADGTYSAGLSVNGPLVGNAGLGGVVFNGNSGSPANVIVPEISAQQSAEFTITGITLVSPSGAGLSASQGAILGFSNVVFGACAEAHIFIGTGGFAIATGNYSITGSAPAHWLVAQATMQVINITITLTGTPNFNNAFAAVSVGGTINALNDTFSGAATGDRYNIYGNGVVSTNNAGATYLPGNANGNLATGGQYI